MHGYPSPHKGGLYHDETTYPPTAEKSLYRDYTSEFIDRTPNRGQQYTPSRGSDRLSEARKSINEAIEMVSAKKSMNN